MVQAGIPVMAHIGFTPQSVNSLGGFRVQGRGDAAEQTIHDAIAVAEAGAFAVVLEMVPADGHPDHRQLTIPTVGIGAGPDCDAQVLVWQDMAGIAAARPPSSSSGTPTWPRLIGEAASAYVEDVRVGALFPGPEHSF